VSGPYRALVLDLDGTLVTDEGGIHPRTLAALQALPHAACA
jgi:hydroxymethylpyrimidine pyrophosphatase-like HAD family hydrolase